jgi:hypothetical protein
MRLERLSQIATIAGLGPGIFGAVVGWLAYKHSLEAPTAAPNSAQVANGWHLVSPQVAFIGIGVGVLCIIAAAALNLWAVRFAHRVPTTKPATEKPTQPALPFTPLQIEAFQLASELRAFLKEIGPRPVTDWNKPGQDTDPDWMAKRIAEQAQLYLPWHSRLTHRYAREFAPKVIELMHHLGEAGLNVSALLLGETKLRDANELIALCRAIDELAIELNCRAPATDGQFTDVGELYLKMNTEQMKRVMMGTPSVGQYIEDELQRRVQPGRTKRN